MSLSAWLLPARLVLPAELRKHLAPATPEPRRGPGEALEEAVMVRPVLGSVSLG